jgi:VWFA-related protein
VVLRATTRLVQVNVIVQDKKGEPVPGLTREDFTLLDSGKEQEIAVFSIESNRVLPGPLQLLPPNVFSNRWESRDGVPTSVTVILLDNLNTEFEDQVYARNQVIKFLRKLQPQDRVALYTLGTSLRIVQDFTSDVTPLLRALDRQAGRVPVELQASEPAGGNITDAEFQAAKPAGVSITGAGSQASNPIGTDITGGAGDLDLAALQASGFLLNPTRRMAEYYTSRRAEATAGALEGIANHLAKLPGRKNLVWISSSFPIWMGFDSTVPMADKRMFSREIERAVQALNDANLAVYPVDPRGPIPPNGVQTGGGGVPTGDGFQNIRLGQDTMVNLAEGTGGRVFFNTNDIAGAVRTAIDESQLTYLLGYYPTHGQWDKSFHAIKVRVDRPGVSVRCRRGYFAMPEEQLDEKERKEVFDSAARGPLDATGVGIYARLIPSRPGSDTLGIELIVVPEDISLQGEKDRWVGSLELVFLQRAADGKVLDGTSKTLFLNLKGETYRKLRQDGLVLERSEKLAPGAVELRIVVRDAPSGSMGSVSVPLSRVIGMTTNSPPPKGL